MPANVVERAMTFYSPADYADPAAIRHQAEWQNGRIDFQPYPYPSATKLIVEEMNKTVVGGDKTFLDGLDADFVTDDLVDYNHVKVAMEQFMDWSKVPGIDPNNPYEREEVVVL